MPSILCTTLLPIFYPFFNLQNFSCKHVISIRVEHSVDRIQIRWLHQKPSDLDLQCFQKRINLGSAGQWLISATVSMLPKMMGNLKLPFFFEAFMGVQACTCKYPHQECWNSMITIYISNNYLTLSLPAATFIIC